MMLLAHALPASAANFTIREQQVLDLIVQKVMQRNQVPKQDVEVEWMDNQLRTMVTALPEGRQTIDIADTARLTGKGNVPVQILIDGKKFRTIFPRITINVFQTVLVAKTAIPSGTQPTADDVSLERKALGTLYGQPLNSLNSLVSAQSTRAIPAGTVLTAQMFKIPPVVKLGSVITVTLISGELTMITSGQARGNGAVGQLIKVLNLESKREYTARVIGPDRAEVKLED